MVRPFDTPEQYIAWVARNCRQCPRNVGTVPGSGCELRVALDVAAANGGNVSEEVAERIGWWDVPKYSWTCGEREQAEVQHDD